MATLNFLQNIEFDVVVTKLPTTTFHVQKLSIPSVTASPGSQPTPLNPLPTTPDRLNYGELTLSFAMDERLDAYCEVLSWLTALTFPQGFDQYRELSSARDGLYSDIRVLLKNSAKRPAGEFLFVGAFPTSLSGFDLDTTQTQLMYPEVQVSFAYDYFTLSRPS